MRELKERLKLALKILSTKNIHIVEHNTYSLVKIGGMKDKQGLSKITTL